MFYWAVVMVFEMVWNTAAWKASIKAVRWVEVWEICMVAMMDEMTVFG